MKYCSVCVCVRACARIFLDLIVLANLMLQENQQNCQRASSNDCRCRTSCDWPREQKGTLIALGFFLRPPSSTSVSLCVQVDDHVTSAEQHHSRTEKVQRRKKRASRFDSCTSRLGCFWSESSGYRVILRACRHQRLASETDLKSSFSRDQ
jgi:hypothetical protein